MPIIVPYITLFQARPWHDSMNPGRIFSPRKLMVSVWGKMDNQTQLFQALKSAARRYVEVLGSLKWQDWREDETIGKSDIWDIFEVHPTNLSQRKDWNRWHSWVPFLRGVFGNSWIFQVCVFLALLLEENSARNSQNRPLSSTLPFGKSLLGKLLH